MTAQRASRIAALLCTTPTRLPSLAPTSHSTEVRLLAVLVLRLLRVRGRVVLLLVMVVRRAQALVVTVLLDLVTAAQALVRARARAQALRDLNLEAAVREMAVAAVDRAQARDLAAQTHRQAPALATVAQGRAALVRQAQIQVTAALDQVIQTRHRAPTQAAPSQAAATVAQVSQIHRPART